MPRAALSQHEVDEFRDALCETATRLFAEHGYEGVTMRALAKSLGCSPMTPYRYFENKAEIFDAVRSAAANRFADAIAAGAASHPEHREKLRAMCLAYVAFATEEPHAYRIMFELDQRQSVEFRSADDLRGWLVMYGVVEDAIGAGALSGDADVVAHLLWSGVHGLVALHLSGMLSLGLGLDVLVDRFIEREIGLNTPQDPQPPGLSSVT